MLNKIMMTGRLNSEPALTTDNGNQYCRFGIEVERPRHYMTDTSKSDTFICIAYDRNGEMISNLFSEGETITIILRRSLWRKCISQAADKRMLLMLVYYFDLI